MVKSPQSIVTSDDATSRVEPADRVRIQSQLDLLELAAPLLPRDPTPFYLAHMRILSEGRRLDVLFTTIRTRRNDARAIPDLLVVDWQSSPLAEVFFSCREGQRVRLQTQERSMFVTVLESTVVAFNGASLVDLILPDGILSRRINGVWERRPTASATFNPRPRSLRQRLPSLIDVTLDSAQERIVQLPAGRSVLVLGEAGHGKTTVALHRLAHLLRSSAKPQRGLIVVPVEGLCRLVESLLKHLRIDVEVRVYEKWAARQARRAFRDIPHRESRDATCGVARLKRDSGLRAALATLAKRKPARIDDDEDTPRPRTDAWARITVTYSTCLATRRSSSAQLRHPGHTLLRT